MCKLIITFLLDMNIITIQFKFFKAMYFTTAKKSNVVISGQKIKSFAASKEMQITSGLYNYRTAYGNGKPGYHGV